MVLPILFIILAVVLFYGQRTTVPVSSLFTLANYLYFVFEILINDTCTGTTRSPLLYFSFCLKYTLLNLVWWRLARRLQS